MFQCREDFEFKKLLFSAMVAMSKDPTAVQVTMCLLPKVSAVTALDYVLLDVTDCVNGNKIITCSRSIKQD